MPPRGKAPGLKRGRHDLPYWIAANVVRDPMGFPDKCIPLPPDASEAELVELCHAHTARLREWIARQDDKKAARPGPAYDGTLLGLSRLFQTHPNSPFRDVKRNTRKTYSDSLKVIETTIGERLVRRITVIDVRGYYKRWREPREDGGRERIKRAHDAVSALRMILRFGFALGHDDCGELDARLAKMRFERSGSREEEMTYLQASAFVRKALELGTTGIVPLERARSMAIGVAAQFELALRQKDIIGEWSDDAWAGPFRWDNIPGWRFRLRTSKNRARTEFLLPDYPLLFPLLEAVPHAEREGAIVNGEHGLPVRERSYRKWFRAIARAAGIPDEVWSMDARAGAATEADEAGADFKSISDLLTHAQPKTTVRYIRRTSKRIRDVAKARAASRDQEGK